MIVASVRNVIVLASARLSVILPARHIDDDLWEADVHDRMFAIRFRWSIVVPNRFMSEVEQRTGDHGET